MKEKHSVLSKGECCVLGIVCRMLLEAREGPLADVLCVFDEPCHLEPSQVTCCSLLLPFGWAVNQMSSRMGRLSPEQAEKFWAIFFDEFSDTTMLVITHNTLLSQFLCKTLSFEALALVRSDKIRNRDVGGGELSYNRRYHLFPVQFEAGGTGLVDALQVLLSERPVLMCEGTIDMR